VTVPVATQPTLRRMAQFGIRPRRSLGQNFLVDSNILGVIDRAAELAREDVVLEIGGGVGVLSEYLAERVAFLHVVEVDRALEPPLRDALAPYAKRSALHLADAIELDLKALAPPPTKVVANLPYGIAASAILRTIEDLPSVSRWIAMVQREVGERFAASPGSRAYGIPSVLAQLACEVRVVRQIPRSVFYPVPRVDSVLLRLDRRGAPIEASQAELVRAAFAHRRKMLASSLQLAAGVDPDRTRAALAALGKPVNVRAEVLSPVELRSLAEALA
jgi:16S rRNA (adenine1518-N6/adenine1519-N6)-dimethyltransferase